MEKSIKSDISWLFLHKSICEFWFIFIKNYNILCGIFLPLNEIVVHNKLGQKWLENNDLITLTKIWSKSFLLDSVQFDFSYLFTWWATGIWKWTMTIAAMMDTRREKQKIIPVTLFSFLSGGAWCLAPCFEVKINYSNYLIFLLYIQSIKMNSEGPDNYVS